MPPFALFVFVAPELSDALRANNAKGGTCVVDVAKRLSVGKSRQNRPSLNLPTGLVDVPAVLCFATSFELKLESHRIDAGHGERGLALRRMWGAPDRIHAFGDRSPSPQKLHHEASRKRRFHQGPPNTQDGGLIFLKIRCQ